MVQSSWKWKMAKEKYIRGKRDDAHHDGLYANRKREQASQFELDESIKMIGLHKALTVKIHDGMVVLDEPEILSKMQEK